MEMLFYFVNSDIRDYEEILTELMKTCYVGTNSQQSEIDWSKELKNPGTNFGNVLEAYYQETTIRKRRFELQEACGKLPVHLLVPLQKILKLKQNFSFTSKNIKKQNIS